MKYLVDERVEKGHQDEPLLTASQSRGVIPKADYGSRTVEAQKDLHLLKLVQPGDYVISLRSFQGGIEYAHVRGIISPAYTVLEPKSDVRRGYFEHFFKSADFINSMTLFVTGIREGQNIDYVRLSRAYMPVPPLEEQDAIGRFIHHLDQRVNRLIKNKRQLIELLNEQKQAIIHRAVIRGLDPTAPLKATTSPYFELVPTHWNVMPLKRACSVIKDGLHGTPPKVEHGIPFVSTQHVRHRRVALERATFISNDDYKSGHPRMAPQVGDVFVTLVGSIGFPAVVSVAPISCTRHVGYVRPRPILLADYLVNYFDSPPFHAWVGDNVSQTAQPSIYLNSLALNVIPCPPADEQKEIVEFLHKETAELNQSVHTITSEIDLIREYRTRLVADVVTGQLDVRHLDIPEAEDAEPVEGPEDISMDDDHEPMEEQ